MTFRVDPMRRSRSPAGLALALLLLVACGGNAPAVDGPEACPAPALRPHYLPWAGEGDPGPPDETEGAAAMWFAGASGDDGDGRVTIEASDAEILAPGDASATPTVRGASGTLVWIGDPGVGDLALSWRESDAACGHLTLWLNTAFIEPPPGTDGDEAIAAMEAEAAREVLRVADSLRG